jgi:hypothetical protein
VWGHAPVISATQGTVNRRIKVQTSLGYMERPCVIKKKKKGKKNKDWQSIRLPGIN